MSGNLLKGPHIVPLLFFYKDYFGIKWPTKQINQETTKIFPQKGYLRYDTKLHPVVRFQFWRFKDYWQALHCYYFLVSANPELGSRLWVK